MDIYLVLIALLVAVNITNVYLMRRRFSKDIAYVQKAKDREIYISYHSFIQNILNNSEKNPDFIYMIAKAVKADEHIIEKDYFYFQLLLRAFEYGSKYAENDLLNEYEPCIRSAEIDNTEPGLLYLKSIYLEKIDENESLTYKDAAFNAGFRK